MENNQTQPTQQQPAPKTDRFWKGYIAGYGSALLAIGVVALLFNKSSN